MDEIRAQDPSRKRQVLAGAAKSLLAEEDVEGQHEHLCNLPAQGQMAWCWEGNSRELWVRAVEGLPPEPMKFALNVMLDTLTTNSNLRRWGKKPHDTCPLCSSHQSLCHVLNNCPTSLKLHRYSRRHDEVLQLLGEFIKFKLNPSFSFTIDLPTTTYSFPQHITSTDIQPDIVWWSDDRKELWLLELTINNESLVADSRQRKEAKYYELVQTGCIGRYRSQLITVEVGSRGMLEDGDLLKLRTTLNATAKETRELCLAVIRSTILESFKSWVSRNTSN